MTDATEPDLVFLCPFLGMNSNIETGTLMYKKKSFILGLLI